VPASAAVAAAVDQQLPANLDDLPAQRKKIEQLTTELPALLDRLNQLRDSHRSAVADVRRAVMPRYIQLLAARRARLELTKRAAKGLIAEAELALKAADWLSADIERLDRGVAMNTLYAYCERPASRAADKPGDAIRFVASTEDVARDGLSIESAAWDLANYKRNPVVLWAHQMTGERPPIAKAVDVAVESRRLLASIVFDQGDPFARQVEQKYRDGYLNAVSVGWDRSR